MEPHQPRPLRVLTLDGGGIRGLSELLILKRLMYRIQQTPSGQPLVKPCEFFDVIGGTSTGGLLAILLGRLEMDIDESIAFYCGLMEELFQQPEGWIPGSFVPALGGPGTTGRARFATQTLEAKLKQLIATILGEDHCDAPFEDSEGRCKVFVCATRAASRGAAVFRSYPSTREPPIPCTIWEVVSATMAMPPFFEPKTIGSLGAVYADGAVKNNNPVWVAVEEIRRDFPNDALSCLVSLGAGKLKMQSLGTTTTELYHACADIARDTEAAAKLFLDEYKPLAEQGRYFRLNVEQGLQDVGITEFADTTVDLIDAATADYCSIRGDDLAQCAQMLKSPSIPTKQPNVNAVILNNREVLMWLDALEEYEKLWELYTNDNERDEFSESDFARNAALRFPDTCDWITSQDDFSTWLSMSETRHCFLHGIPGSGKTVLAAYVGKWLRETNAKTATLVFFCDSKDERKSAADSFFRNAIVQLLYYKPHLIHNLAAEMGKTGRKKVLSWAHLRSIFLQLLHEFESVHIVVDAVDELNTLGQDVLSEMISKISISLPESTTVATFITSRTRADVLAKLSFCRHTIALQRGPFDEDLRIFISLSVDQSEELQALFKNNSTFVRELKESLLARSEGMFLLPKLLLQELKSKETIVQMRQVLNDIPNSLSEYYTQFMDRIEPSRKQFALRVFSWLACTFRPLSLEELQIGLELETQILEPQAGYEIANLKFSVEKACSCLVVLQNGRVQLAHSSIKRYLLRPQDQDNNTKSQREIFDTAAVHEGIAMVCLNYLSSPEFSAPLSGESRFSPQNLDGLKLDYPYLQYACQFWQTHVGLGPRSSVRLLIQLSEFLGSVNCRSYIELVFSYWTFPNVTMEDVSNTLISWVPKEPTCHEEDFIFRWARDLWDLGFEMSGLFQEFPSEIHFLQDLLPSTEVFDRSRVQKSLTMLPESLCATYGAGEAAVHESADASGQTVARRSDRFVLTETAMVDWESTISTPKRYLENVGIRWEVHVQNLQTQKRYARHSLSLCRREGICCSVAIAPNDQHCAVSWPEYQDDDATEPLKIKTYAWSLRWDETRSPVWRKWEWTDRQYGCDYTRAAGFTRTKNSIAFTADSEILATPGGFYNVATGALAFAPPIFSDSTVSGLTFSSNAEYVWGTKDGQRLVVYRRDSADISFANDEPFHYCEVIAVSQNGLSAIVLLQHQVLRASETTAELSLVTSRNHRYQFDTIYTFAHNTKSLEVCEQWEYIRSFYASGGQIQISDKGRAIVGLPRPDKDSYQALMFEVMPFRRPAHTKITRQTLKAPKNSSILSVRFQRGTGELYGLTDLGIVWRFSPKIDSPTTSGTIWEAQMQRDDGQPRNFVLSDYSPQDQTIFVTLQLGDRPKFGTASIKDETVEFTFQSSPVTKLLEITQNLQRTAITVDLCSLMKCFRQNNTTTSLRLLGVGQTSPRRLENFIPLSEQFLQQCAIKKFGETTSLEIYSHYTSNHNGSIVACSSIFLPTESLDSTDGGRKVYYHVLFKCLDTGLLASFERRLGMLTKVEKVILQDFKIRFDTQRRLVAIGICLITSAGLDDRRFRYDTNQLLDLSTAFQGSVRSRSPSSVMGLFLNPSRDREALNLSSFTTLDSAMEMAFCSKRSRIYCVERQDGRLTSYSTEKGREDPYVWSIQIFGEWSVFEAHHMHLESNTLRVLGLTFDLILCLVEIDLEEFTGRRRYVSSMWGRNIGNGANIFMDPLQSTEEAGLKLIVCHNQQTDASTKLDPEQTETNFKPTVIFVSEQAMGPWISMAWEKPSAEIS